MGIAKSVILYNIGDKRRQMNTLRDGGGRNDHILMSRGDMPPMCAVNTTYNDRLHPPTWRKKATPWLMDRSYCGSGSLVEWKFILVES